MGHDWVGVSLPVSQEILLSPWEEEKELKAIVFQAGYSGQQGDYMFVLPSESGELVSLIHEVGFVTRVESLQCECVPV